VGFKKDDDGPRLHLDLENMGRLGLLALSRGSWNGVELIPRSFVEALEQKQTRGMKVNYNGPDDGIVPFSSDKFPESPYGYMTWVNTDGDVYPGADRAWAWGAGAGGTYVLWNRNNGIVFAAQGRDEGGPAPTKHGIPQIIEANLSGQHP
jgi:CubicO group peptidase (beta-lactamase class C family)